MDWLYTPFSKVLLFHPKKAAHSPGEMIRLMLRGSSKLSSLLKLMRVGGLASRPLTLAHLYTLSFFDAAGDIFTMLNFLDQTDVQFEMIPCDFEVVTDTLRRESMIYRTIAETSEYEEGSTKLRQIWLMRRRWWFIQEIDHLWHGVLYLVGPQGTRTRAILRGIALDPVEGERLEVLTDDVAHIEEWATCRIEYLTGGDVPTFDPMLCLNKMQSFYELSWKATKFRDMKHSHFMPETPLIITAGSHPATLAYLLNRQMPVRAIVKLADSLARDEHLLRVLGNEMPTSVLPDVAKHISNKPPETSADLFYSVSVAKIRATLQKLTCHRLSREETLVFEVSMFHLINSQVRCTGTFRLVWNETQDEDCRRSLCACPFGTDSHRTFGKIAMCELFNVFVTRFFHGHLSIRSTALEYIFIATVFKNRGNFWRILVCLRLRGHWLILFLPVRIKKA